MARHLKLIDEELHRAASEGDGRILLTVPPRHGKSELTSKYFPAWYLGWKPDNRVMLCSYEADFASGWGRKARGVLEEYGPGMNVLVAKDSSAANRWDIAGRDGGMVTAGVGGPITGKGGHLLIIDDPIKNYEEAHSPTIREKVWDWFTSTAYTRLEPGGSVIVIQTRWHEDDLTGRILKRLTHEKWKLIRLPALAEEDDPLGRKPGEALWPARFDEKKLDAIRRTLGSYQWSALYQQNPTPREGGFFRREWFRVVSAPPVCTRQVRLWDLAATEESIGSDPDWCCGWKVGITEQKQVALLHRVRFRGTPAAVEKVIEQTAQTDGPNVAIVLEQEGGASGKGWPDSIIRYRLQGYNARYEKPTTSKENRAQPLSAQAEVGNVLMVQGPWVEEALDEFTAFPNGTHDDQVDSASGAYNWLTRKKEARVW